MRELEGRVAQVTGGGAIVDLSSIEASRAAPMYPAYAACKTGMNNSPAPWCSS